MGRHWFTVVSVLLLVLASLCALWNPVLALAVAGSVLAGALALLVARWRGR